MKPKAFENVLIYLGYYVTEKGINDIKK